jgi:hypothetical protein
MSLIKKHSIQQAPTQHKLKHTISDITSDRFGNKTKECTPVD